MEKYKLSDIEQKIKILDAYLAKNDYASAEHFLRTSIEGAQNAGDLRSKLSLLNELIGLCRKVGKREDSYYAAESALALCEALGLFDSITYATTCINAATAYVAFEENERALPLYQTAEKIYEALLDKYDSRLGGLYNNMALALVYSGNYDAANELYLRALAVMEHNRYGQLEMAITYLNMANAIEYEYGWQEAESRINECIDRARELLDTKGIPRNGYYAFVCEKCAPTFGHYGYFLDEIEFQKRAKDIYFGGADEGN